jgi:beta-ureidopropionase
MSKMVNKNNRLPREVWVASISLKGLWPTKTIEQRITDVFARMESVYAFEPDIICLPETFQISWVNEKKRLDEIAEDEINPGPVTSRVAEIAKRQNCYIVCPVITKKDGRYFNSSILINRQGKIDGVFHKVHPTDAEVLPEKYYLGGGVIPGPLRPPVFKTDFGTVGLQICMDAAWPENWQSLKEANAEIVLFSSQASYGDTLVNRAWVNHYYIVSGTGDDARIIDISGDIIAADGEFARWVCAPVNLEKAFIHIWPQVKKFDDIQRKYGRKLRIKIYHPENWATLESVDPDIKVSDVLKEFDIPTYDQQIKEATEVQNKYRL